MKADKIPWEENYFLWEKWSSDCSGAIFKAMEESLQQSTSFRGEIDKAMNAALNTQMGIALAAIKVLEGQITTLSAQVEKLMEERK
jgi:hypothetical protein